MFLPGTSGKDRLHGQEGDDLLLGREGDDRLYGHEGNDKLSGDGGADELYGGSGNDILLGGSGNDELWGDEGDDFLTGGEGSDYFLFSMNFDEDHDVVNDFTVGVDHLYIATGGWAPPSAYSFEQVGNDTLISYTEQGYTSEITLVGVDQSDLDIQYSSSGALYL